MNTQELNELWKYETSDKATLVDPYNEHDWKSLCLGWAIAKGLSIEDAQKFVRQAKL